MMKMGKIIIGRMDLSDGLFTYGQRIELGGIFSDTGRSEYRRLADAFKVLYGYKCTLLPIKWRVRLLNGIVEGLTEWIRKESEMLAYTPTDDEERAGIAELTRRVGSMGTIDALAEKYGKDPDEILGWSYAKVFGILFSDLEKAKYQRRYDKMINEKYSARHRRPAR